MRKGARDYLSATVEDRYGSNGSARCAACGATALRAHLRVAGDAGERGLIPTTDRYGTALADIVRCAACGHGQLERLPSDASLSEAYAEAESRDYVAEEEGQRATARRVLIEIERHVRPGRLLDLGCWVGFLLAEARDRGWEGVGIEPSEFASVYARDQLGLDVRTEELMETELEPRSFGAVVMADVIEHLPDPGAALDRVAGLLAPGGAIALALPDAGSRVARLMGRRWWSVIPTHVHYFTRSSLRVLLERHGYDVLSVATAPKTFSVRYYLERIGGYRRGPARALVRSAEAAGVADRPWTPDFRDRMLVVARAPS
jgi:SAM-dependent methyltransferase